MNASFVNGSVVAASKLWGNIQQLLINALISATNHMFTHIQTHTPTWLDWPSFSPSQSVLRSWADSDKYFSKVSSPPCSLFRSAIPLSISPYVPFLMVLSTPLSACLHPVLFIQAWPWTPHTPLWSLFFPLMWVMREAVAVSGSELRSVPFLTIFSIFRTFHHLINWIVNAKLPLFFEQWTI